MSNIYTLPNATSGIDTIAQQVLTASPSFIPLVLFFIFSVIFIGGAIAQRNKSGFTDIPFWGVIASMTTLVLGLILSFGVGLIQIEVIGVVIGFNILFGLWFLFGSSNREV